MSTQKADKSNLQNTFELIAQAGVFLDFLPSNRARSMVGTKLDEATLWLTQVVPDEPDEPDQEQGDDPFGIWPDEEEWEAVTQKLADESPDPLKDLAARELDREVAEACEELGVEYPQPEGTQEDLRAFRSLMDRMKSEKQATEYPDFPSDAFAFAAGPPLKAQSQHFDNEQAKSGIEALTRYKEVGWRGHANAWRNEVRRLDGVEKLCALGQMRALLKALEDEAGVVIDGNGDYHRASAVKHHYCTLCADTGWVPRAANGLIYSGRPFSSNYKPCPDGCDGGRGFSDPIPYDPKTGKIITDTDTEDDGA